MAEWIYRGWSQATAAGYAGLAAQGPGGFASSLSRLANDPTMMKANADLARYALDKGFTYGGSLVRRIAWQLGIQTSSGASTAGITLAGAGITSAAAILAAVAAGIIVIGAAGAIYVYTADEPIKLGPVALGPRKERPVGPGVTYNADDYYVFLLSNISGGSILVGQESVLKTTKACEIAGGGLCSGQNDPLVEYQIKSAGFKTYDQAAAAWCAELKGKKITNSPVAGDSKAEVYGGAYWIGTAPACPSG
ncbi:hypothetical protein MycrhDRAFT_0802 [Mycolicibacterium rhodesiae JS60]|nr:hypothetical protein MycrhDRAFT_0802 [Mycolicibacterium rhodesiae JS60]